MAKVAHVNSLSFKNAAFVMTTNFGAFLLCTSIKYLIAVVSSADVKCFSIQDSLKLSFGNLFYFFARLSRVLCCVLLFFILRLLKRYIASFFFFIFATTTVSRLHN